MLKKPSKWNNYLELLCSALGGETQQISGEVRENKKKINSKVPGLLPGLGNFYKIFCSG